MKSTVSPEEITAAVTASFAGTLDPRIGDVAKALVHYLHAFVVDVRPTHAEWAVGIDYLTRVGHMCQGGRQEFILLSDVLGVSMLVDALSQGDDASATESTILGPFYVDTPPTADQGTDIASGSDGMRMWIDVQITDSDGAPLEGAVVDIWQCDTDGMYDIQREDDKLTLRARFVADAEGRVRCWSVVPIAYQIPSDGPVGDLLAATGRHPWRPAHVHFKIGCAGFAPLVTHLFVEGGDYLDSDAVFGVKPSLIVSLPPHEPIGGEDQAATKNWCSMEYGFVLQKA